MIYFSSKFHCFKASNFESNIIKELNELTGVVKSRTAPYNPQDDGQSKRLSDIGWYKV